MTNFGEDRVFSFSLTCLFIEPFIEYKIVVVAITTRHDGNASIPILQKTDVAAPSTPIISNLACQKNGTILLRWKRPVSFNTIDYYIASYKNIKWDRYRQFQINASTAHMETEVESLSREIACFYSNDLLAFHFSAEDTESCYRRDILGVCASRIGEHHQPHQVACQQCDRHENGESHLPARFTHCSH